jgi:hypothetical protein
MAIAARTLLGTVHPSQLAAVRYLVASGMLGSLAQGDRVESSRLLSKYKETMFGDSQMDLLFRLLASESMAH